MKLVSFSDRRSLSAATRLGALRGGTIVDLSAAFELFARNLDGARDLHTCPTEMIELLRLGPKGLDLVRELETKALARGEAMLTTASCRVTAPVAAPPKLVCVGLNYRAAAEKVAFVQGEGAPIFLKATSTIIGPDAPIVLPRHDVGAVMAEVELGLVIGKRARHVHAADALSFIAGYTTLLDVTAQAMMDRDAYAFSAPGPEPRMPHNHIVLFRAKDYDSFTPIGPALVTSDEVDAGLLSDLRITASINEEVYVDGTTADMLISVPDLIAYISSVLTLVPGDIVATGHPGYRRQRPLTVGSRVEANIGDFGALSMRVEADGGPEDVHLSGD